VQPPVQLSGDLALDVSSNGEIVFDRGIDATGDFDLNKTGGGAAGFGHLRTGGSLTVGSGEIFVPASPLHNAPQGASRVGGLNISGGPSLPAARVSLANNALVIDYADGAPSPLTDVRDYLEKGRSTSFGIVGQPGAADGGRHAYLEATDLYTSFPAEFAGQPLDATSVLLAYTLPGDANLDLRVDIADFSAVAAAFNAPGRWRTGDFDYDGVTGIADFSLLAARFNQTLAADSAVGARTSPIPEPTFAGSVAAVLASLVLARCRAHPLA
jgi:hypothetical protein